MKEPIYQIDDVKVTRVTETILTLPKNILYPDASMSAEPMDEPLDLSIHAWLVQVNGKNIIVDTGIGNWKPRSFSKLFDQLNNPFLERLSQVGMHPDDIDMVLLTHLHTDHVGWNTVKQGNEWVPTFKNATYYAPQKDLEFFFKPAGEPRRMLFDDSILPLIVNNQLRVIPKEGQQLTDFIRFEPTPGHCEGHMAIRLTTENNELLFTGDVMHHEFQVSNSEVSSTFCLDVALANATRRRVLNDALVNQTLVFPAHFRDSSAGKIAEDRNGNRMWLPIVPTQLIEVD